MSANPNNASRLLRNDEVDVQRSSNRPFPRTAAYHAPGREALQALLAFSSLHDQIRRRRTQRLLEPEPGGAEQWQSEQFLVDEVLQLVCDRALAITGTDGVAIAMADGDEVLCRAAGGDITPDVGARLNPNSGFSGACFRSGMIVRCDDVDLDPRVDPATCHRMGVQSMVAVPLLSDHGVVGLISAFCADAYGFNDSDIRSLSLLAELVLAALHPEENMPPAVNSYLPAAQAQQSTERRNPVQQPPLVAPEPSRIEGWNSTSGPATLPNVQSVRDALSRVTEETQEVNAAPAHDPETFLRYSFSQSEEPPKPKGLVTGLIILGVLALILAGLTVRWWYMHSRTAVAVPAPQISSSPSAAKPSPDAMAPSSSAAARTAPETRSPQVNGIRHWSSADSSTVAIDLQEQVQYEAHRLSNPERIYFDLRDTVLASGVARTIEVGDPLLTRIRIAQPSEGMTRVVLETRNNPNFSVSLSTNPYRLMIEIRSVTAKPKTSARVDLFGPLDSGMNQMASSSTNAHWLTPSEIAPLKTSAAAHANKFRIVIDAGHGGWDMGTVGRKGLLEKDLVLDVVARVGKLVASRLGAEVIYTRGDDTYLSLEKRTEVANLSQADMFLSVHANYSDSPTARGVETYYTNTYSSIHARTSAADTPEALNVNWTNVNIRDKVQQSRRFAQSVQQSLFHALAAKNPEVRNRGVKEASYVVLTGTTMPAVLAEVSFVSSPADETNLLNAAYRQQIAEALFKGVSAYSESSRHLNLASASPKVTGQ